MLLLLLLFTIRTGHGMMNFTSEHSVPMCIVCGTTNYPFPQLISFTYIRPMICLPWVCLLFFILFFTLLGKPQIFFLMYSPLRPFAPPLGLVDKRTATKKRRKKKLFSLIDNPLPTPLLVNCPLEKNFFVASLNFLVFVQHFFQNHLFLYIFSLYFVQFYLSQLISSSIFPPQFPITQCGEYRQMVWCEGWWWPSQLSPAALQLVYRSTLPFSSRQERPSNPCL